MANACLATLHLQNTPQPALAAIGEADDSLLRSTITEEALCAAVGQRHAPNASWSRLASRFASSRVLRVAAVGMSSTAGCGARSPSHVCDGALSWGRRMHEALRWRLCNSSGNSGGSSRHRSKLAGPGGPSGASAIIMDHPSTKIHTHVYAKNAVTLSFYAHCPSLYVPADTDILLIEAFQNMFDGVAALETGLRALRRQAPLAVIVFVFWPDPFDRMVDSRTSVIMVRQLAREHGADILDAPRLMGMHGSASRSTRPSVWFAQHCSSAEATAAAERREYHRQCRQDHHPSAAGHQLLGELAAHHIQQQLLEPPATFTKPWALRPHTTGADAGAPRLPLPNFGSAELCFTDAAQLPVPRPQPGWELRDEGAGRGVAKRGYVSSRGGTELELGPLPIPAPPGTTPVHARSCAAAVVRLGYHASSRAVQGVFRVSCRGGCTCYPVRGWLAQQASPFPNVHTRLDVAKYGNMSVTMNTEFLADFHSGARDCMLTINHLHEHVKNQSKPQAPTANGEAVRIAPTRVRIDSLSVRLATLDDTRNANYSREERYQRFVRHALECNR